MLPAQADGATRSCPACAPAAAAERRPRRLALPPSRCDGLAAGCPGPMAISWRRWGVAIALRHRPRRQRL